MPSSGPPSKAQQIKALNATETPIDEVYANVLVYGSAGAGKTVELLKLAQLVTPADKEIIFFDSAQGMVAGRNHPGVLDRVRRFQFKGVSQLAAIAIAIEDEAEGYENVGTIIVDEVSSIAKEDLSTVVVARQAAGKLTDYEGADWPGYNANLERVSRELRKLYKLPINILLSSHMRDSEPKGLGHTLKRPSMPPELAEVGNGLVHVVAYMSASVREKNGNVSYTHTLQVHPTTLVFAKSRVGGLPIKTTPDDFNAKMVEFVQGKIEITEEEEISTDDTFLGIEAEEG